MRCWRLPWNQVLSPSSQRVGPWALSCILTWLSYCWKQIIGICFQVLSSNLIVAWQEFDSGEGLWLLLLVTGVGSYSSQCTTWWWSVSFWSLRAEILCWLIIWGHFLRRQGKTQKFSNQESDSPLPFDLVSQVSEHTQSRMCSGALRKVVSCGMLSKISSQRMTTHSLHCSHILFDSKKDSTCFSGWSIGYLQEGFLL